MQSASIGLTEIIDPTLAAAAPKAADAETGAAFAQALASELAARTAPATDHSSPNPAADILPGADAGKALTPPAAAPATGQAVVDAAAAKVPENAEEGETSDSAETDGSDTAVNDMLALLQPAAEPIMRAAPAGGEAYSPPASPDSARSPNPASEAPPERVPGPAATGLPATSATSQTQSRSGAGSPSDTSAQGKASEQDTAVTARGQQTPSKEKVSAAAVQTGDANAPDSDNTPAPAASAGQQIDLEADLPKARAAGPEAERPTPANKSDRPMASATGPVTAPASPDRKAGVAPVAQSATTGTPATSTDAALPGPAPTVRGKRASNTAPAPQMLRGTPRPEDVRATYAQASRALVKDNVAVAANPIPSTLAPSASRPTADVPLPDALASTTATGSPAPETKAAAAAPAPSADAGPAPEPTADGPSVTTASVASTTATASSDSRQSDEAAAMPRQAMSDTPAPRSPASTTAAPAPETFNTADQAGATARAAPTDRSADAGRAESAEQAKPAAASPGIASQEDAGGESGRSQQDPTAARAAQFGAGNRNQALSDAPGSAAAVSAATPSDLSPSQMTGQSATADQDAAGGQPRIATQASDTTVPTQARAANTDREEALAAPDAGKPAVQRPAAQAHNAPEAAPVATATTLAAPSSGKAPDTGAANRPGQDASNGALSPPAAAPAYNHAGAAASGTTLPAPPSEQATAAQSAQTAPPSATNQPVGTSLAASQGAPAPGTARPTAKASGNVGRTSAPAPTSATTAAPANTTPALQSAALSAPQSWQSAQPAATNEHAAVATPSMADQVPAPEPLPATIPTEASSAPAPIRPKDAGAMANQSSIADRPAQEIERAANMTASQGKEGGIGEGPSFTLPAGSGVQPASPARLPEMAAAQFSVPSRLGSPDWDDQVGQKLILMVRDGHQAATLTLNPPELGPIRVTIEVTEREASASFVSAQPEVRQALEQSLPKLRDMMQQAGLQLGQANVSAGQGDAQQAQAGQQQSGKRRPPSLPHQGQRLQSAVAQSAAPGRPGIINTYA